MITRSPLGLILRINAKILFAVLLAWGSYAVWPTNPEWWHFGVLSLFMAVGALDQGVAALRLIVKLTRRERAIDAMREAHGTPKSAGLASDISLKNAGVLDE